MDSDSVHTKGDDVSSQPKETPVIPVNTTQAATAEAAHPQQNSAGVIVLQWLTYAFWGWLILGLLWLMGVILSNAILGESTNESVPYAIAASVVLLPLAFFCDFFYRKHEPVKKAGSAMVIMVVHAVLFAILGIISLIVAVFIGIDMLINTSDSTDGQTVGLLVAAFAALLYVGAFLRTLNPFKAKKPTTIYTIVMASLTLVLLALAVAGPVITSVATRGDRIIEQSLPQVQTSIEDYITENEKLPTSLGDVTFNNTDARELAQSGKVEYKSVGKVEKTTLNGLANTSATYRYELCVEYKAAKNADNYRGRSNSDNTGYTNYLSTYSHDAGRTCYKLQQTIYQSNDL